MTPDPRETMAADAEGRGRGLGSIWRRMRRNIALILGGRAVFGLLNLAAAALAVRAVGIEAFGVAVLLQAYVRLIGGLLKFQSWSAVTRFGAEAAAKGRWEDFNRLIGFMLRLDIVANLLSIVIGVLAAPYVADYLDWPPEAVALAPWFVLTVPFITSATPTGLLRLFDRFGALVRQHALNAIVRFVGSLLIFLFHGGVEALIFTWAAASFLSGGVMFWEAVREMRARGVKPKMLGSWSSLSAGFPRIWRFVFVVNASTLLDTVLSQATVLVVGGMLGPAAAGLYGLVRQVTESMNRISSLLGPIVFPEFAWLEAQGDRRTITRLLGRTLAIATGALAVFCLFLFFASEPFLLLLFGDDAAGGGPLFIASGLASAVLVMGFAMEPVLLTIRKEKAVLYSATLATLLFCVLLAGFIHAFGLLGAGLALLLRQTIVFFYRLIVLRRALVLKPAKARAEGG